MKAAQTQLIPMQELTPGMVTNIRNTIIGQVCSLASHELNLPESSLVVRDIEPYTDLGWRYSAVTASAGTAENWQFDFSGTTVGYKTVAEGTMTDQRFVAIFGVRDLRTGQGGSASVVTTGGSPATGVGRGDFLLPCPISLIKFNVGGANRAIWDSSCMEPYRDARVAFSPSCIMIPQNSAFVISYYERGQDLTTGIAVDGTVMLVGVTVEPRGKLISA